MAGAAALIAVPVGITCGVYISEFKTSRLSPAVRLAADILNGVPSIVIGIFAYAIAVAFAVPDLWWQAQHGWAAFTMTRAINREDGGPGNIADMVIGQLTMTSLAMVWVWIAGLRLLWRSRRPRSRSGAALRESPSPRLGNAPT